MAHNNTTHNTNNLYTVDIVSDPNTNDGSTIVETTLSGVPFYTMEITPNNVATDLVIAGNFTIDGIISSWSWDANLPNGSGANNCYPPKPPYYGTGAGQAIKNTIAHPYVFTGSGSQSLCWGASSPGGVDFVGNGYYRFQGPYVFDNSAYCDGAFLSSSKTVTWRKIYLIDIYEMSSGFFANNDLSPAVEEDISQWVTAYLFNNYLANVLHNGYPTHLKAFVFPEYHPTNIKTSDMSIDLDIDMVAPNAGCVDSNATSGYDSTAEISDPSACAYGVNTYGFQIQLSLDMATMPNPQTPGPYTNGTVYGSNTIGYYSTVDYNGTYPNQTNGNISFDQNTIVITNNITSANTYAEGDTISENIEVYVYRISDIGAFTAYDFPYPGEGPFYDPGSGVSINLSPYGSGNEQRMFWGWGDTKNNLTAASLRVNSNVSPNYYWRNPIYDTSDYSEWHYSGDVTGSQPTKKVTFSNITTQTGSIITSLIEAEEIYNSSGVGGDEWFPEKIKINVVIDSFVLDASAIASQNLNYNDNYVLPINIYHNTENQGTI